MADDSMLCLSDTLPSIAALMLGAGWMAACGGSFAGGDDDSGGQAGSGGQGARAGSTSTGGSTGKGGSASGGESGGGCEHMGTTYAAGESFPMGDGCNSCFCGEDGAVACTGVYCAPCDDIQDGYAAAIVEAKTCDPEAPNQCTQAILVDLQCGCQSFVNPEQTEAIASVQQAHEEYATWSCGGDVQCEQCQPPTSGHCSPEGRCVDVFEVLPSGVSCKVNGTVYANGDHEVPDPFSCNTCFCENGELTDCTEAACPATCPPDSVPSTQCAQCGPVDNCEVVEHGCLPVCTDTCQVGACLNGVCRMVCG